MGWLIEVLSSGFARRALGLLLAALFIALFLLNLRRPRERAGRLAERLQTSEKTQIQRQMLDAASHRAAIYVALARRMRDGQF